MAEHTKAGPRKKFSITIQVPDDVTAHWPDRTTAERLIEDVYQAMNGAPVAQQSAALQVRPSALVLVVVALLAIGGGAGYLGARVYMGSSLAADRPMASPALRTESRGVPQGMPAEPAAVPQPAADTSQPAAIATGPQLAPAEGVPQPSTQNAPASPPAYHVQVGAFRLPENAESLVQLLDRDGFQAQVLHLGSLHIVYVGTFTDAKAAERFATELRAHHYDVVVIQSQGN